MPIAAALVIIVVGGAVLSVVNAFRRPPVAGGPTTPTVGGGKSEKRFGFDGDVNSADEDTPALVAYGTVKLAGPIVSYLTGVQDGKEQWVTMLIDLGEGPYPRDFISKFADTGEYQVFIDEKPSEDYQEVYWQAKRGTHDQLVDSEVVTLSDPIEGEVSAADAKKAEKERQQAEKKKIKSGGQKAGQKNLSKKQKENAKQKQKALDASIPGLPVGADPVTRFNRFNFNDQVFVTNNGKIKIDEVNWQDVTLSAELRSAEQVHVGFTFDGLFKSSANGGIGKQRVEFWVRFRELGTTTAWQPDDTGQKYFVEDRSTSPVFKEVKVIDIADLLGQPKKWQVQVKRVKAENKNQTNTRDAMFLSWGREVNETNILHPWNALLGVRIKASDQLSGNLPNIFAIFRAREVYDPRTLTVAWSDNPALCVLDWLSSGEATYDDVVALLGISGLTSRMFASERGFGMGNKISLADDILLDTVIEVADYFDEQVRVPSTFEPGRVSISQGSNVLTGVRTVFKDNGLRPGDTIKLNAVSYSVEKVPANNEVHLTIHYTGTDLENATYEIWEPRSKMDLVLTQRQSAPEQLRGMTATYGMFVAWVDGRIGFGVEKDNEPSVQVFTPDNFIEDSLELSTPDIKERFNAMTVRYIDAAQQYIQQSISIFDDEAIRDGEELNQQTIELSGVTRRTEAFRLGVYHLNVSRLGIAEATWKVGAEGLLAEAGQVVGLVAPKYGLGTWDAEGKADPATAVQFRIQKISKPLNGEVTIDAIGYVSNLRDIRGLLPLGQPFKFEMPSADEVPDAPEALTVAEARNSDGQIGFLVSVAIGDFPTAGSVRFYSLDLSLPDEEQEWLLIGEEVVVTGGGGRVDLFVPGQIGNHKQFSVVIISQTGLATQREDSPVVEGILEGISYTVPDIPFVQLANQPNVTIFIGAEPSFEWPDVARIESDDVVIIDGKPIAVGGRDPAFDAYIVRIKSGNPLVLKRTAFRQENNYTYAVDKNVDDHGDGSIEGNLTIEVTALGKSGLESTNPAILAVTQKGPTAIVNLRAKANKAAVQFQWDKSQDKAFDHYEIRFKICDTTKVPPDASCDASFSDVQGNTLAGGVFESIASNKVTRVLTDADITTHGASANITIEVKAVNQTGGESAVTALSLDSQPIKIGEIDPGIFQTTASTNSGSLDADACIDNDVGTDAAGTLAIDEYLQVSFATEQQVNKVQVWAGTGGPFDVVIDFSLDGASWTRYHFDSVSGKLVPDPTGTGNWVLAAAGNKSELNVEPRFRALHMRVIAKTASMKLREIGWAS